MLKVILLDNDYNPVYVLEFPSTAKNCITVNDLIISPHIENGYGFAQVHIRREVILDTSKSGQILDDMWTLWKHFCDPRTDE